MVPAMKITSARFITSAVSLEGCPPGSHPEVALIGRSNVGKSSLVNLLVGRHSLAQVSATPGKTRTLNFYLINSKWSLVDLPGYGFARTNASAQEGFSSMVGEYLSQREQLRHLFVLIDSRHPPQAIDLEFLARVRHIGVPLSLIFTKADKLSAAKAKAQAAEFLDAAEPLVGERPDHVLCSATNRTGRLELLGAIGKIVK
jgi:GTP-binding protein